MFSSKIFTLISGMISGLVFAPTVFVPGLFFLALLCYRVQIANSWQEASILGFIFGFGHWLVNMYWIVIIGTIFDEFRWAIPLSIFGLSTILASAITLTCILGFLARNSGFYQLIFCVYWVFFEWVRSWIFTGLPWNLLGYAFSFSDTLIQPSSIIGVYGLSFIVVYIPTSFYHLFTKQYNLLKISLANSLLIMSLITSYGLLRLHNNPTSFSNVTVRLVQPSISQTAKWDVEEFWKNLNLHLALSKEPGDVDLIIWSEAAMVVPYDYKPIKIKLSKMLERKKAILITGGITNNGKKGDDFEIYTSLYSLTKEGDKLFEYHKSHLVPFGEYMPLKWILPLEKITSGWLDYTEGIGRTLMNKPALTIKPLVCYEVIFPNLVRTSNKLSDVIINVTNDTWYGNSFIPYQHLQISRMRSVENGLPMLRTANNGISAVIDPVGRIIQQRTLNEVGYIDSLLPNKLEYETLYSQFGDISA